jgi:cysteine desulfurase
MLKKPVYMDYSATTPVDPRVLAAMSPYFTERFGNAASRHHAWGWEAEEAVEIAREQVARCLGADPKEILFTSGATESNNLALTGVMRALGSGGGTLLTSPIEHPSVLDAASALAAGGVTVRRLSVGPDGRVRFDGIADLLEGARLVSLMHANNETGVIQPVDDMGALCKERGILFHVDATQSAGKLPLAADAMGADLISMSAHKIYGPKGVGALYVRRRKPRVRLEPLLHGGGHEGGIRSGTLNVPGIVGMGAACALAEEVRDEEILRVGRLRDALEAALARQIDGLAVHGRSAPRLPGLLNVSFDGVTGEALLGALRGLAVSTGSACTSGSLEPSYVLRAMGVGADRAKSSLRFSLGRPSTEDDVVHAVEEVAGVVTELRTRMSGRGAPARTGARKVGNT